MDNVLCGEWIKRMKAAGFSGTFRAVDITGKIVVNGVITKDKIETVKVKTSEESRQKIKDMFKNGS
jgi:hypothetical protein